MPVYPGARISVLSFPFARKPSRPAPRVNHKSPWPLWGGSAARFGRSAEPLCWICPAQSASPLTLPRSMASEPSFAFCPGLLTVRQRQRRDPAEQRPVEPCQSREVLLLGQHLSLEGLQPGGQSCPSIPDLFGADQSRLAGSDRGAAARHRSHPHTPPSGCTRTVPPCGIGEGQARILRPRVGPAAAGCPMSSLNPRRSSNSRIPPCGTTIRSDSRPLKIDPQGSVKAELKGLVLSLTHRACTS